MSYPHDAVRILPVAVGHDGAIEFLGMRWWSEESEKLKGRMVELRLAPNPRRTEACLLSTIGKFLCKVRLIDDGGLFQREEKHAAALKEADQRLRDMVRAAVKASAVPADEGKASVIRRKSKVLAQIIDSRIDATQITRPRFGGGVLAQLLRYVQSIFGQTRHLPLQRAKQGSLKAPTRLDVEEKLALLIFDDGEALFDGGHSVAPDAVDGLEPSEADEAGHRLSGGVK